MMRQWADASLTLEDVPNGLLVRQSGEEYIVKNWQITQSVCELIDAGIAAGLGTVIRLSHPMPSNRGRQGKGVVHLSFSASKTHTWSVSFNAFNHTLGDFRHAVIHKRYRTQFEQRGIEFGFEKPTYQDHLRVERDRVIEVIGLLGGMNHGD
jgi:hypothetical protein